MSHTRVHVLSIRDDPADEQLIAAIWRTDPEIKLQHVQCGVEALAGLQRKSGKIPNLILLAWRFNESQLSATETLHALKADGLLRAVPVVVLAGKLSPENIEALYVAGVACVFERPADVGDLECILREIKVLWLNRARLPYERQQAYTTAASVTVREKEVIRLLADDLSGKEIAGKLGISLKTVEFHVQSIKLRTGVTGKAGIIRFALKAGILSEH
jgi:DNA-binding NarL/FixJ family response regulator